MVCKAIGYESDIWAGTGLCGQARKKNPGGLVVHAVVQADRDRFKRDSDFKNKALFQDWASDELVIPIKEASGCKFSFGGTSKARPPAVTTTYSLSCSECNATLVLKPRYADGCKVEVTATWKEPAVKVHLAYASGDSAALLAAGEAQQQEKDRDSRLRKGGLLKVQPGDQLEAACNALGIPADTRAVLKGNLYEVKSETLAKNHAAAKKDSSRKRVEEREFSKSKWAKEHMADMTGLPFAVFTIGADKVAYLLLMYLNGGSNTTPDWPDSLVVHQDKVWAAQAYANVSDRGPNRQSPVNLGMAGMRINVSDQVLRFW